MKTFVTILAGVLLALSCVATSDARLHANREGQTQSEPSNYNPDYNSQTNTRNWDNSCLHCGATTGLAQTLPSYAPHQVAVLGAPTQMAQKPLPSYEFNGVPRYAARTCAIRAERREGALSPRRGRHGRMIVTDPAPRPMTPSVRPRR